MDQPQINPRDIAALSDTEKRELQQVLNNEMQKAKVQEGKFSTLEHQHGDTHGCSRC